MSEMERDFNEFVEREVVETGPSFVVDTLDKAEWATRKVLAAQARLKEAKEFAARQKEMVEVWLEKQRDTASKEIEYFEGLLQPFARDALAEGRKKSVRLPSGTIGFRSSAAKTEVVDETAFADWAKENEPQTLRYTIKVDKRLVQQMLKSGRVVAHETGLAIRDGEVIPGVVISPPSDKFYVKEID